MRVFVKGFKTLSSAVLSKSSSDGSFRGFYRSAEARGVFLGPEVNGCDVARGSDVELKDGDTVVLGFLE